MTAVATVAWAAVGLGLMAAGWHTLRHARDASTRHLLAVATASGVLLGVSLAQDDWAATVGGISSAAVLALMLPVLILRAALAREQREDAEYRRFES